MLRTRDLEYNLPEGLVATRPATPRDAARLMVATPGANPVHAHVRDLPSFLRPGDVLVFNTTKVLRARLVGHRLDTGGRVEGLYLRPGPDAGTWVAMLKARRFREGSPIALISEAGQASGVILRPVRRVESEPGAWVVAVEGSRGEGDQAILDRTGHVPIPPYILAARARSGQGDGESSDAARYQTVYARDDQPGSVAAPTAGLHFTPELLAALDAMGVERVGVVLHVGTGTFKAVETEHVEDHPMHEEWCWMDAAAMSAVEMAKAQGRRVIAVGTTSARVLETYARTGDRSAPIWTRLLITPGHRWRWVDGLLTNFHLPRSTLLAMVGAMTPGGMADLLGLYREAMALGYRFYSYGDAMLITSAAGQSDSGVHRKELR